MNHFSAWLTVFCGALAGITVPDESAAQGVSFDYRVSYQVTLEPAAAVARVEFRIDQPRFLLREWRMQIDPERFELLDSDGEIAIDGDQLTWIPNAAGGFVVWNMAIGHRRNGDGYDAWLGDNWGIFRAEDVIPRATTRTLKGAVSDTELRFSLPRSWSVVTEYFDRDGTFHVDRPERRFDEPTGWIVAGKLGVRRDTIAGTRVAIAAPVGETTRRLEALALMRWTLPELARALPGLPERLTIVSAGEPMWRGALSAPASLFIHAERPLISENATSPLLHEVVHVATGLKGEAGYDWIVEGLAEFYSLELLLRSDTISKRRHAAARRSQQEWSRAATTLCGKVSTGATTALAVTLFAELDAEIRASSGGNATLDNVLAAIVVADQPVNLNSLRKAVKDLTGRNSETLHTDKLPGCSNITREES